MLCYQASIKARSRSLKLASLEMTSQKNTRLKSKSMNLIQRNWQLNVQNSFHQWIKIEAN